MDLFESAKRYGEHGSKAKLGALACFVLACALLVVSLIMPQSTHPVGSDAAATITGSVGRGN
jgi:hypothetical protein